jgi:thioredoxin 1
LIKLKIIITLNKKVTYMASIIISDSSFEKEVLKSENLILVDFWAEWCGPCKMIGPALEEISEEMKDDVRITKLNIDENPATPQKYNVRGIPTLLLFKNGEVVAEKVGALPKAQLQEWISSNVNSE